MAYPTPTAYLQASVETASPARLLVMLYDRLVLDCRRAVAAQESGDQRGRRIQLLHAQDIVAELQSSLRPDAWDGGQALNGLYTHLLVQLVRANVDRRRHQDPPLPRPRRRPGRRLAPSGPADRGDSVIGRVPEDGEELFRAWERALDALGERDVLRAEHLAADPAGAVALGAELPSGWLPTGLDGTIPATLVERAGGLLRRQELVQEKLAGALDRARATSPGYGGTAPPLMSHVRQGPARRPSAFPPSPPDPTRAPPGWCGMAHSGGAPGPRSRPGARG